ncbi:MAG: endonuclease/exonuclease/phosphatase family protein [Geminicoccaceae bacterium]
MARAREVRIVTYNQYLGADIVPLVTASAARFNATLLDVLAQVARNRFPARAERQAELIAKENPDLVGLQEVWDFSCQELPPTPGACAEPRIRGAFVDQLQVTLDALRSRRAPYVVAARVKNFDTAEISVPVPGVGTVNGLPFTINGRNALLLVKDRDVILRRWNVPARPVAFAGCTVSQQGCSYVARLAVPLPALPGVTAVFRRGFVAVDAMVRGQARRFVVTHLEVQEPIPGKPLSMVFQAAQAVELIARLAAAPNPKNSELVLAGDLNSAPTDRSPGGGIVPPYRLFLAAGYRDTWTAYKGTTPDPTCCQDADLRNGRSKLTDRIDHVFVGSPPVLVLNATRIGENVADRTPAGPTRPALWPSDHAGVSTRLYF